MWLIICPAAIILTAGGAILRRLADFGADIRPFDERRRLERSIKSRKKAAVKETNWDGNVDRDTTDGRSCRHHGRKAQHGEGDKSVQFHAVKAGWDWGNGTSAKDLYSTRCMGHMQAALNGDLGRNRGVASMDAASSSRRKRWRPGCRGSAVGHWVRGLGLAMGML
ncbi:hypothetical protein FB451DRAFT_1179074 [Mycena latifolia]|nr:hypothetical protein FB451DRAFT_1179074 [Mycena latifolia]